MNDVMDMRDKMHKVHKLQMMGILRVPTLPDDVVKAYYAYKTITDRIDALLVTADLMRILEGAGAIEIDWPVKPKPESVAAVISQPTKTTDDSAGNAAVTETVDLSKKPDQEKELSDIESELSQDELVPWPADAVAKGTTVTVFHEGRPTKVEVTDATGTGHTLAYMVQLDGEDEPRQFLAIDVMVD